jgi:hypothetical protein
MPSSFRTPRFLCDNFYYPTFKFFYRHGNRRPLGKQSAAPRKGALPI